MTGPKPLRGSKSDVHCAKSAGEEARLRKARRLVPLLLDWFGRHARDLPWRHTHDPYAIWVSEIMLQQTQVKTVLPYWERWMRELSSLEALAKASPEKVLKLWEGLGYYTRARHLQQAAQSLVARRNGQFPEDFAEILSLPGIGRYTAGAICSIAFNQPKPVLDGNVIRVLTRLFGIGENPRERQTNAKLWTLAERLVQTAAQIQQSRQRNCSHLNQSLMELGALVCTPKQPQCSLCPVRRHCLARRQDRVAELPNLGRRPAATDRHYTAFVIEANGRFLVRQRPPDAVNAQLWEFPNLESDHGRTPPAAAARKLPGPSLRALDRFCTVKHTITRYRITLEVYRASVVGKPRRASGTECWCSLEELEQLPFTSAHGKIRQRLAESSNPAVKLQERRPRLRKHPSSRKLTAP